MKKLRFKYWLEDVILMNYLHSYADSFSARFWKFLADTFFKEK